MGSAFGGGGAPASGTPSGTTTSTTQLTPEQRQLLNMVMPTFREYARNPPELMRGSGIAGFNRTQERAQDMLLDTVGAQRRGVADMARANEFLLGDVLDPDSNRYLRRSVDAAIRPLQENFREVILPGIRGEAITAGQLGSSRQGIAEGIASRALNREIGDRSASMYSDAYGQGLDAMQRAFALTPQTLAAMATPAGTMAAVGDARQAMTQQVLNERAYRHMYEQVAPFMAASEIMGIVNGLPGGTTINRGYTPPPQTSAWGSALGGAATGASIGSAILPGWGTAIGAGVGGLGGWLMS